MRGQELEVRRCVRARVAAHRVPCRIRCARNIEMLITCTCDVGEGKKKKKKKKPKKKSGSSHKVEQQTEPPTVGLSKLFPDGNYPEGELQDYKDEYVSCRVHPVYTLLDLSSLPCR